MRVLHLYMRMNHGGAEMRLLDRLGHPAMQAFEHHFCMFSKEPGLLDAAFRDQGVTYHHCPVGPGFPVRFARLLRQVRPDVVHANQQWMSASFLAEAAALGVPGRVAQFHASGDFKPESSLRRLRNRGLRRLLLHSATAISGVSEGVLDSLFRPSWRQHPSFRVDYLGVDLTRFATERDRLGVRQELGIEPDAPLAVHVGNMGPAKDHPRLGSIFADLAQVQPTMHLLVVGRRNPTFEDPMLRNAGPVADRVHVLGARTDVARLLLAGDLFLLPSRTEGLPTVVLEARAAGLPCVVSDLPGNHEIAARLDRVTVIDRHADWTEAVAGALASPADDLSQANPLAGTPFAAAASAEAHAELWRQSVAR